MARQRGVGAVLLTSHDFPLGVNQLGLAQLNERSREIFRLIVESYLATGEPVGSRNLSRILPMTLSPASVRNVMSDLEQLGLVYAPHTSAGRLPTEMGLRFFVDALMQIGDLTERDRKAIEAQVAASGQAKSVEGGADRSVRPALGLKPRRRRRAHRQSESAAQTYRIRAARARTRAGHPGRRGRPGRKPRPQYSDRPADLGADRSREFPQRAHPRPHARRGQGRDRAHAQGERGPTRSADPEDRRRRAWRAGRAARATSAS